MEVYYFKQVRYPSLSNYGDIKQDTILEHRAVNKEDLDTNNIKLNSSGFHYSVSASDGISHLYIDIDKYVHRRTLDFITSEVICIIRDYKLECLLN